MKKFIIFSIASIVIATMGLMTYRFLTLEESILVNQTVFEINVGDELPLEIEHINPKPTTHIVYESLNEDVIEVVNYLGEDKFKTKGEGGKAVLRISSNAKGFAPIIITVTVGDGKESTPFFVKDAKTLASIGVIEEGEERAKLPLDAYYTLMSDIDVSTYNEGKWTPIGQGSEDGFTGVLNANNHTISGIRMTQTADYAGLFAKIGVNQKNRNNIYGNLSLTNCRLEGEFSYAGVLAGENNGKITRVDVVSSTVSSTKNQAMVGGLVGKHTGEIEKVSILNSDITSTGDGSIAGGVVGFMAKLTDQPVLAMSYCEGVNVSAKMYIGGLAGNVRSGLVAACYTRTVGNKGIITNLTPSTFVASMGGLIGRLEMIDASNESEIDDCYSKVDIVATGSIDVGNLIGYVATKTVGTDKKLNKLFGLYYDDNGYRGIGSVDNDKITTSGPDSEESSYYQFIYNTLDEQNLTAIEKYLSHTTMKNLEDFSIYWNYKTIFSADSEKYPGINMNGVWQSVYPYGDVITGRTISSYTELERLRDYVNNPQNDDEREKAKFTWTIASNITLPNDWIPIGTKEHPFNGTLTCETDANGNPLYSLTGLTINSGADGTGSQDNGLFGYIGGKGKVMNIKLVDPSVKYGQCVGSIAGVNYGVVINCTVCASDSTLEDRNVVLSNNSTYIGRDVFIGGLVGYNFGSLYDSRVENIRINFKSSKSELVGYIGGLTGYNVGIISNCSVSGSNTLIKTADGVNREQYIGGITSMNNDHISSCYINGYQIKAPQNDKNTYVGGVVAYNGGNAVLTRSFAKVDIEGGNSGGVASLTFGQISECYFNGTIEGLNVGGIAYNVANGTVKDCYANGTLYGSSDDSIKAGFACSVALVSEDEYLASMDHCYSSMSFGGKGDNYADTKSPVRADYRDSLFIYRTVRRAGFLFNSIYDRTNADESICTRSDSKTWPWDHNDYRNPEKLISDYNSDRWLYSYKYDTGMTTEEIKSEAGANVFRTYGYDESIWILDGANYPTLRNVPVIK